MSLASDLLSPRGRIAPGAFLRSALILIVAGAVLSLLALVNPILGSIATLLSLALIYPWIAIWVKRLHDAGQSGWMLLPILLIWFILAAILLVLLLTTLAPGFMDLALAGDQAGVQAATAGLALPNAIGTVVVSLIVVLLANLMLRSEPGVNRFGEPAA